MSPLRERMIAMQLRGLSANTQEVYMRAVRQLVDRIYAAWTDENHRGGSSAIFSISCQREEVFSFHVDVAPI